MIKSLKSHNWAVTCLFIILVLTLSSFAQNSDNSPFPDTAINPHDFTDEYYDTHGINHKEILGRRAFSDGLSVFGWSSDPNHTNVRVIATIPAYNQSGEVFFWYPLGELMNYGFTSDDAGTTAREMARLFPIYIFPDLNAKEFSTFANNRQAALISDPRMFYSNKGESFVFVREILIVRYSQKAFSKKGHEMMTAFAEKNGYAADDTPLIKSIDDLYFLLRNEMITLDPFTDLGPSLGRFAISPLITDPTRGAIADDAFLWMARKDKEYMPGEEMFVYQFGCLQKTLNWCKR